MCNWQKIKHLNRLAIFDLAIFMPKNDALPLLIAVPFSISWNVSGAVGDKQSTNKIMQCHLLDVILHREINHGGGADALALMKCFQMLLLWLQQPMASTLYHCAKRKKCVRKWSHNAVLRVAFLQNTLRILYCIARRKKGRKHDKHFIDHSCPSR